MIAILEVDQVPASHVLPLTHREILLQYVRVLLMRLSRFERALGRQDGRGPGIGTDRAVQELFGVFEDQALLVIGQPIVSSSILYIRVND